MPSSAIAAAVIVKVNSIVVCALLGEIKATWWGPGGGLSDVVPVGQEVMHIG